MCIGAAVGAAVNIGLYLWSESQQSDGIDLHIDISIGRNGLNVDAGNDWGDFLVAGAEGAVAGALIATPGGATMAVAMGATMGEYLAGDQIGNIVTGDNFSAENHFVAGMSGLGQGFVAGAIPLSGLSVTGQAVSQIGNASVWGGQYTLMTNGNASGFITSGITQGLSIGWSGEITKTVPNDVVLQTYTSWFPSFVTTVGQSFIEKTQKDSER